MSETTHPTTLAPMDLAQALPSDTGQTGPVTMTPLSQMELADLMNTMPRHAVPAPPGSRSGLANWAKAAAVRAVKTAAQAALAQLARPDRDPGAAVPASAATIGTVDWSLVAGTAALSAIMSLLTSIAGLPEVDSGASVRQMAGR